MELADRRVFLLPEHRDHWFRVQGENMFTANREWDVSFPGLGLHFYFFARYIAICDRQITSPFGPSRESYPVQCFLGFGSVEIWNNLVEPTFRSFSIIENRAWSYSFWKRVLASSPSFFLVRNSFRSWSSGSSGIRVDWSYTTERERDRLRSGHRLRGIRGRKWGMPLLYFLPSLNEERTFSYIHY